MSSHRGGLRHYTVPVQQLIPGQTIGKYRVERAVGPTPLGTRYIIRNTDLDVLNTLDPFRDGRAAQRMGGGVHRIERQAEGVDVAPTGPTSPEVRPRGVQLLVGRLQQVGRLGTGPPEAARSGHAQLEARNDEAAVLTEDRRADLGVKTHVF